MKYLSLSKSNWKKQKCSVPRKTTAGIWGMFAFMFVLGLEKYQGFTPSFSSDPLLCVKKKKVGTLCRTSRRLSRWPTRWRNLSLGHSFLTKCSKSASLQDLAHHNKKKSNNNNPSKAQGVRKISFRSKESNGSIWKELQRGELEL